MCKKVVSSALLVDSHKRILLAQRRVDGLWTTPGGKVEPKEYIDHGCVRELREETGLLTSSGNLHYLGHSDMEDKVVFFYLVLSWGGTLRNMEPKKHTDWQWMADFPDINTLVPGLRYFKTMLRDEMYGAWSQYVRAA